MCKARHGQRFYRFRHVCHRLLPILVEYDTDYTNLWRIPFRRSGTKETLRWEDREKVCKLEDIIKKDSPGIDWEDFLYAEDNKVIFSSENDGILQSIWTPEKF